MQTLPTPKFVPGVGNPNAKLMIVGEAPGATEDRLGQPFVGESGKMLTEIMRSAGISRSEVWLTNVVKYRPPANDFSRLSEIGIDYDQQVQSLLTEINGVNPNVLVAVGNKALKALTGISKTKKVKGKIVETGILAYRGSILRCQWGPWKVIPMVHPATLLHDEGGKGAGPYWQKSIMAFDLHRAHMESSSSVYDIPQRNLWVCRNSAQLYDFIRRHPRDRFPDIDVDIETYHAFPVCIALAFTPWESVSIPLLTQIENLKLTEMPHSDLAECWRLIDLVLRERNIIGQNFKFDEAKLKRLGFRLPKFKADTMHMSHTIEPELPKSQGFLTSIYTREPYYKDEGREFNPRYDKLDRLYLYNAKDSAVNIEIFQQLDESLGHYGLRNFYYDFVRHLHKLYLEVEEIGLRVDNEQRDLLRVKYQCMWDELQGKLNAIVGAELNVNSWQQVGLLLDEFKVSHKRGTGEEQLTAILANHGDKKPVLAEALELVIRIRQVRKTLGTYIEAKPDYDGRMRTSVNIVGTETGRTSNSILKAPLRPEKIGLAFQTMTKHGDVGADLRTMFVPDPGFVFVNIDQSQAEARVVALLAEDYDQLAKFGRFDIHCETAVICLGLAESAYGDLVAAKKRGEDPPERFIGKTFRHAGNYDMGKHRAMVTVNTDAKKYGIPIRISEWKASQYLLRFHNANPKIRGVFHRAIQDILGTSPRQPLFSPHGRMRKFYDRYGDELFKEAYAFIPQATVSDQTKLAMLGIHREMPDLQILLEAHDAILTQMRYDEVADRCKVIKTHFEKPIDFSKCSIPRGELIIPCEFEIGEENYKKLKPYKLAA